mgnify:CR=1 FL=1
MGLDGAVKVDAVAGTRRRAADPVADEALAAELAASSKDALEVDLVAAFVDREFRKLERRGVLSNITASKKHVRTLPAVRHLRREFSARLSVLEPRRAAWDAHEAEWRAFVRSSRAEHMLGVSDGPWPPSTGEAAIAAVRMLEPAPQASACSFRI